MTDQQQRTQHAQDRLRSFLDSWTPPAVRDTRRYVDDVATLMRLIAAITPPGEGEIVGWAVFKREIDSSWDRRQHPSGYVHTQVGAVFDKPGQADTVQQSQAKRYPDQEFIVGQIIERRLSSKDR